MELYRKLRPTDFDQIVGQQTAVKTLQGFISEEKTPHAILLTGPSGVGKTTIARILRNKLNCGELDFVEMNAADKGGIDYIRRIRDTMNLSPMAGTSRVWLVEECHQLTEPAQQTILKMLEDCPNHVYFILTTTNPESLLKAIRTRCTEIKLSYLTAGQLAKVIRFILGKEKKKLSDEVISKIIVVAEGSARKALVLLEQVLMVKGDEGQLEAIDASDAEKQAIELARTLFNYKSSWSDAANVLKNLKDDAEGTRRLILAYANKILLSGGKLSDRAYLIISVMRDNLFASGKAGLSACCYEIFKENK